jgi:hypothetical protein
VWQLAGYGGSLKLSGLAHHGPADAFTHHTPCVVQPATFDGSYAHDPACSRLLIRHMGGAHCCTYEKKSKPPGPASDGLH